MKNEEIMEEIINEIWKDAEKLGWEAINDRKDYYLALVGEYKGKLWEIDCESEIVISEANDKYKIIFECSECHAKFTDRDSLYDHHIKEHKNHTSL